MIKKEQTGFLPGEAGRGKSSWRVYIIDHSGGCIEDDNVIENISGFISLDHANAFARAYIRDSIERCRAPGISKEDLLAAWLSWGEDVRVAGGDNVWVSSTEIDRFMDEIATSAERNWRSLDPRQLLAESGYADAW